MVSVIFVDKCQLLYLNVKKAQQHYHLDQEIAEEELIHDAIYKSPW